MTSPCRAWRGPEAFSLTDVPSYPSCCSTNCGGAVWRGGGLGLGSWARLMGRGCSSWTPTSGHLLPAHYVPRPVFANLPGLAPSSSPPVKAAAAPVWVCRSDAGQGAGFGSGMLILALRPPGPPVSQSRFAASSSLSRQFGRTAEEGGCAQVPPKRAQGHSRLSCSAAAIRAPCSFPCN